MIGLTAWCLLGPIVVSLQTSRLDIAKKIINLFLFVN